MGLSQLVEKGFYLPCQDYYSKFKLSKTKNALFLM